MRDCGAGAGQTVGHVGDDVGHHGEGGYAEVELVGVELVHGVGGGVVIPEIVGGFYLESHFQYIYAVFTIQHSLLCKPLAQVDSNRCLIVVVVRVLKQAVAHPISPRSARLVYPSCVTIK